MLIVGIVVVALLLCCCLPICGYGVFVNFFANVAQNAVKNQNDNAAKKLQQEMEKAFKDIGAAKGHDEGQGQIARVAWGPQYPWRRMRRKLGRAIRCSACIARRC